MVDDGAFRLSAEGSVWCRALQWNEKVRELPIDDRRKRRNAKKDGDESENTHVESSLIGVVAQVKLNTEVAGDERRASQLLFLY
jgi:hypothetical protein